MSEPEGFAIERVEFKGVGLEVEYTLMPTDVRGAMSRSQVLRVPYHEVATEEEAAAIDEIFMRVAEATRILIGIFEAKEPAELERVDEDPLDAGPYDNPNDR